MDIYFIGKLIGVVFGFVSCLFIFSSALKVSRYKKRHLNNFFKVCFGEEFRKNAINRSKINCIFNSNIRALRILYAVGQSNDLKSKSFLYKKLWFFLNAGLISSVIMNIVETKVPHNVDNSNGIDKNTVIGMLIGEKIKSDTKSYIYILLSVFLLVVSSLFGIVEFNYWLLSLLCFLFSMINLNHKALEYRISHGLYGDNEYEAREIISYIECHSDSDDFHNNNGGKAVFQEIIPEKESFNDLYGGILR